MRDCVNQEKLIHSAATAAVEDRRWRLYNSYVLNINTYIPGVHNNYA